MLYQPSLSDIEIRLSYSLNKATRDGYLTVQVNEQRLVTIPGHITQDHDGNWTLWAGNYATKLGVLDSDNFNRNVETRVCKAGVFTIVRSRAYYC